MLGFLNGCSKNSSCDVLTLAIILWLITTCLCGKGKRDRDCDCENECRHERKRCFDFDIDICTIILLFVIFGGHKMFKFDRCC